MTRAIVYVPADDPDHIHAARCTAYAEQCGYELTGLVRGDWPAVEQMLGNGETSVVLVSEEGHLPPKRKPRIEVVANAIATRWERRTRVIRRNAAK